MPVVHFPYGKESMSLDIPEERFLGALVSEMHHYKPAYSQQELVNMALEHPIGTPKLCVMAEGKQNILIIASDHTRPVPSKVILPPMLAALRKGAPEAQITILISTGCHRASTEEELLAKFGPEIMAREKIVMHDCDSSEMVNLGKMPSGGEIVINKLVWEADLVCAEGFIEPHFFAGFSGGRKSIMPGVASRETVLYNHNAAFINHPRSRAGVVEGNLIHQDMLYACRVARLAFICNVVINAQKEVVYAVAGDADLAHIAGRDFLSSKCMVQRIPCDIAISTNGGYPLDQNIYQAVKGMTAAEGTVKKGGVIIMLAKSSDGHGGDEFHKTFQEEKDLDRMLETFLATPKSETRVDQWQSQIFARVLKHARVVYVSDAPEEMVRDLHMTPARSLEEAMRIAEEMLGNPEASVVAIPDGVAVMVVFDIG